MELIAPFSLEGSHSGLVRSSRKALLGQPDREFKSRPLRHTQKHKGSSNILENINI